MASRSEGRQRYVSTPGQAPKSASQRAWCSVTRPASAFSSAKTILGGRTMARSGQPRSDHFESAGWYLYDPDFSGALPKWTETVTGTFWGLKLPGYGPIFKEAGNIRQSAEVKYDPVLDEYYVDYVWLRDMRGVSKFDVEKLCSALGY